MFLMVQFTKSYGQDNRRQAITWTNVDQDTGSHMASLECYELRSRDKKNPVNSDVFNKTADVLQPISDKIYWIKCIVC